MRPLRITALCLFAFAVTAFCLNLVLLLAGGRPGYLSDDFMISVRISIAFIASYVLMCLIEDS